MRILCCVGAWGLSLSPAFASVVYVSGGPAINNGSDASNSATSRGLDGQGGGADARVNSTANHSGGLSASALAIGGSGAAQIIGSFGGGFGSPPGPGGVATAQAFGANTASGANSDVSSEIQGGAGGAGQAGATGADSISQNAVGGSTRGGALILKQTATGGGGGTGSNSINASTPPVGAPGAPIVPNGGRAGIASSILTFSDQTSAALIGTTVATGGRGGLSSFIPNNGLSDINSGRRGGDGGSANSEISLTGAGNVTAAATATGGAGGDAFGRENNGAGGGAGGTGGVATARAAGASSARGANVTVTATQTGGAGGFGAIGGAGADSVQTNAVSGSTNGGNLTLRQTATGGAGASGSRTDGRSGSAQSSLTFDERTSAKITAAAIANGGTGGASGGSATSSINVQGAGDVDANAEANGGASGSGAAGDASAQAYGASTGRGALVTVSAIQSGGSGTANSLNGRGDGANSTQLNAVSGSTIGGTLILSQGSLGGGASSNVGARGGNAVSNLESSDSQSAFVLSSVLAAGGNGGGSGSASVSTQSSSGVARGSALAIGGRGIAAQGAGATAGDGGIALARAIGSSLALGSNAIATADVRGGDGGVGSAGANGGNGADAALVDAVGGSTNGGVLFLEQYAGAGNGGAVVNCNPCGTRGLDGKAVSSLAFDDRNNAKRSAIVRGLSVAAGAAEFNLLRPTPARESTATVDLTAARAEAQAAARSTGAAGAAAKATSLAAGEANAVAIALSSNSAATADSLARMSGFTARAVTTAGADGAGPQRIAAATARIGGGNLLPAQGSNPNNSLIYLSPLLPNTTDNTPYRFTTSNLQQGSLLSTTAGVGNFSSVVANPSLASIDFSGCPNCAQTFNQPGAFLIGAGAIGGLSSGHGTYSTTTTFTLDASRLTDSIFLGITDFEATSASFDMLRLTESQIIDGDIATITVTTEMQADIVGAGFALAFVLGDPQGQQIRGPFDFTFTSSAQAAQFLKGAVFNLGSPAPVPIPSSGALMLLSIAGLGPLIRRQSLRKAG